MAGLFDFLPMVLAQQGPFQALERTPEPSQVTDAAGNVLQYDRVMTTKLALGYAAGLEIIYRARPEEAGTSAVDLACGPGHYTLCLAKYLGYTDVTGLDLSRPMVEAAAANAARAGLAGAVKFQVGDVTKLSDLPSGRFDLASFTGAAHHMPDLKTVAGIVRQMDRIASPHGLVMIMDLARLRTARLTEHYVNTLGQDYKERGLGDFFDDFRNTMYAVWTPDEMRQVIPRDSARWWCHVVPRGLPTIQVILGLPLGRDRAFLRRGFAAAENPLVRQWYPRWRDEVSPSWADQTFNEWKLARLTLITARKFYVPPGR